MADIGQQQATSDFDLEQQRRQAALDQLGKIRQFSQQGLGQIEEAQGRAQKTLGQTSAAALASTLGQVGGAPAGGGQAAVLRQAAVSQGVAQSRLDLQQAQELSAARTGAAEKQFETISAEEALGTLSGDRQKKFSIIEQNIQNLMGQFLSGTLGIGNNVFEFRRAAAGLLNSEGDPAVRQYIQQRIDQVTASNDSFNLINFLLYPLGTGEGAGAGL